jgi:CHASE3 domain sensor protein
MIVSTLIFGTVGVRTDGDGRTPGAGLALLLVSSSGGKTDFDPVLKVAAEFREFNQAAEARAAKTDDALMTMTARLVRLTYVLVRLTYVLLFLGVLATIIAAVR